MNAQMIYDTAPFGALIRFSDGTKEPPARHTRKLTAWKARNNTGVLVSKAPASDNPKLDLPATFSLREGELTSNGVTCVSFLRSFGTNSPLTFEVLQTPQPGSVLILSSFSKQVELLHLAADQAAAEAWLVKAHGAKPCLLPLNPTPARSTLTGLFFDRRLRCPFPISPVRTSTP